MKSLAEMTLAAQLEVARIPFERQYRFNPERKHRADFFVPPDLLIECDGGTWQLGRHNHPSSVAAEYEKGALAAIRGFRVIHCTTEQVNNGTCYRWITEARAPKLSERCIRVVRARKMVCRIHGDTANCPTPYQFGEVTA